VTARVVFQPHQAPDPVPFDERGRDESGAWGVLDDQAWLAWPRAETLELLYLSPAEFGHATRRLSDAAIAEVVALRRRNYSTVLPGIALGALEMRVRDCIAGLGTAERDTALRRDLLSLTATFTLVSTLADASPAGLFDRLRAGESWILAELESPSSGQQLETKGEEIDERTTRRRFALEVGQLAIRRGQPQQDPSLLPYHDVERTYLITPSSPDLQSAAHAMHEPTMPYAEGLIMPVPEREIDAVCAGVHQATVVFPTRHQFLGAADGMTAAQLKVEIGDRITDPGFGAYLRALRLRQATLRAAAELLLGNDAETAAALHAHAEVEARLLPEWLNSSARGGEPEVGAHSADAKFLVELCARRGTLGRAGALEPFARGLSQLAARG
jgi:hypothetical protein